MLVFDCAGNMDGYAIRWITIESHKGLFLVIGGYLCGDMRDYVIFGMGSDVCWLGL